MIDQPDKDESIDTPKEEESADARKEQRRKEWGEQYDKWLIQCSFKRHIVEFKLAMNYPGVTKDNDIVTGIILRVDKDNIQILVDHIELWLNKSWIVGGRRVSGRPVEIPSA